MLKGETPNMAYNCVPQVSLPIMVFVRRCSGGVKGEGYGQWASGADRTRV